MITDQHERLDFSNVPQSKGITKPAYIVLVTGIIGIFAMGFLSVIMSGYGHMWKSQTTMRMCLQQDTTKCPKGTTPQH